MFDNILHFKPKHKVPGEPPKILRGLQIAILATDGFEQVELYEPKEALEASGAHVEIISLKPGKIRAWKNDHWGKFLQVNRTVDEVSPVEFDALMLPGGVLNPDKLRDNQQVIDFVKSFVMEAKPIAAICHGAQILIETHLLNGRTLTSWPAIKSDLINAGATWIDQEVVVDRSLLTSRKPADIPAFNQAMIRLFSEVKEEVPLAHIIDYTASI